MKKRRNTNRAKRPLRCPHCGAVMMLRPASEIYHDCTSDKKLLVCNNFPRCDDELSRKCAERLEAEGIAQDTFDKSLEMLVKRKLVIKGVGYTGADALYNMLADTYVVPVRGLQGKQRFFNVLRLLKQRKVTFCEAVYLMQHEKVTEDERRVLKLVMQTPLSVAELIRCFENSVRDVSSADKVIAAIYTDESDNQARLNNASSQSDYRREVLEATANLYLTRQVILEHA